MPCLCSRCAEIRKSVSKRRVRCAFSRMKIFQGMPSPSSKRPGMTLFGSVAPGSKDEDVLALAVREERIILTFDKDFGELAWRTGLPVSTGIVLFRLPMPASSEVGAILAATCSHAPTCDTIANCVGICASSGRPANFARLPEKLSMPSFVPVTRALLLRLALRARSPQPL